MLTRRLFILTLLVSVLAGTGCQPKKGRTQRQRIGRAVRGPVSYDQFGMPRPFQSSSAATAWGEVTSDSGDQNFQNELYFFALPSLANMPSEEQLGYVSGQSSQQTGVAFWGEVRGIFSQGQVDGARSRLHIEVYDDRYGVTRADGSTREQLVVHIGADQQGFVRAYGNMQQGITFEDVYGSVTLRGSIQGQYFVGEIYYANQYSGGSRRLGRFSVPAQGFFFN